MPDNLKSSVAALVIRNAVNVGSLSFHLRFDDEVLQFLQPAIEGPFMGSDGTDTVFLAVESGPGGEIVVGLSRVDHVTGVSGEGGLATFRFQALAPGSSDFSFTGARVKDPEARSLPAVFEAAQVQVVP